MKLLRCLLAVVLTIFMVSESYAVGTSFLGNEVPSARAAGAGDVGVAGLNEDPTAVYTNPAAMTNLPGTETTVGATWENRHGDYQSNSGQEVHERVINTTVPNVSATQSLLDGRWAVGLSAQSPFGLETHWDSNSPTRYVATNSRLRMVDITPAVAYQLMPQISLGLGADYVNVFDAQLDNNLNNDFFNSALFSSRGLGSATSGSPDGNASFKGSGANWGYHAGVMFQPTDAQSVGITYHSQVNLRLNGNVTISGITGPALQTILGGPTVSLSAYADTVLPSSFQLGYGFKPTPQWLLEADAAWYHWSVDRDLNIRFPSATAQQQSIIGNMGGTSDVEMITPRDAWSIASGVNYKVNDRWQLRGGFWYEPSIIPEQYFSPAFMDLTRYGLSSGASYAFTKNLSVDVAYTAVFTHTRVIGNNVGTNLTDIPAAGLPTIGVPSPDISGTYKEFANLFALNVNFKFGAATAPVEGQKAEVVKARAPNQASNTETPKSESPSSATVPLWALPDYQKKSPVIAPPQSPDNVHQPEDQGGLSGNVMFQFKDRWARQVELVGDFNQWQPEPLYVDRSHVWLTVKALPPGTYRYNFVVNGKRQILDPWNAVYVLNCRTHGCSELVVPDLKPK